MKRPNPKIIEGKCYTGEIPSEEIENYKYKLNEPLLFDESRDNTAFLSKTDNLIPDFVNNLIKYIT